MILSTDLQYFTSINSFVELIKYKNVYFNEKDFFRKSTFRNRMLVIGSTGIIQLTIPIKGGRNLKIPYNEILIDYKTNWQLNHIKTFRSIYGNSPWFRHYQDELETIYSNKIPELFEWNMHCLNWILKKFKFSSEINIIKNNNKLDVDFGTLSDNNLQTKGMSEENSPFLKYQQVFEEKIGFRQNVSSLDLLLNEGPDARNKILHFIDEVQ